MDEMDLVYRVLDDDLIDVNGRRCGKVDDIEIDGEPGKPAHVTAILSGIGLWRDRLPRPLRGLGRRLFPQPVLGRNVIRVPWSKVEEITAVVRLREPAPELGLGQGDDDLAPLIERIPGS